MRPHLLLLLLLAIQLMRVSSAPAVEASVVLLPDGWAEVSLSISGIETPSYEVRIQGRPYDLIVSSNGILLNYTISGSSLRIETLGLSDVEVNYWTPSLTSKQGIIWNASLSLPSQVTHVLIPSDATVVGISAIPEEIGSEGDWIRFTFNTGSLWVSYKFESIVQPKRVTRATQPETSIPKGVSESEPKETSEGREAGQEISESSPQAPGASYLIYLIPLLLIAPVVLLARRAGQREVARVDEIEESIIRELRARGGEMTQADLTRALNLPRATVWRRLRRLEREGVISLERRGNSTLVRLRR